MQGKIDRIADGVVQGWLRDSKRPGQRLIAEVMIDGLPIGNAIADARRGDLVEAQIGDGLHGFEIPLPQDIDQTKPLRVTLQTPFGATAITIDERLLTPQFANRTTEGKLEGLHAGVLHGWAWNRLDPSLHLTIVFCHRNEVVGDTVAKNHRADLATAGIGNGDHAFAKPVLELPDKLGETPLLQIFAITGTTPVPLGSLTLPHGWRLSPEPGAATSQVAVVAKSEARDEADDAVERASSVLKPATAKSTGKSPGSALAQPGKKPNFKEEIAKSSAAESKGDLAEALAILDAILAVDPKNIEALFRRARVALSMGNIQDAKQFALAAIERQKDHPKAHVTLARVAELEGQRNLALEYWAKVPKAETAYRERLLKAGRILAALERPREGLAALLDAVALKPEDVAARKSLLRLARDLNDLPLAQSQRDALAGLGAPATEASLLPKTLSESESIIRRYSGAMTHMHDPIVLGVGSDLQACLIGGIFANALAAHFDTKIDVVVPEATEATDLLLRTHKNVRRLLTAESCRTVYELAILLPEFALAADGQSPGATLSYSFVESRSLSGGSLKHRLDAYRSWLAEITGAPQQIFDEASLPIPETRSPRRSGPVLLLERDVASEWPGYPMLFAALQNGGYRVSRFDITPPLDDPSALASLLKAIAGAGLVVTADETIAALAALLKAPVVFAAGSTAGHALRDLAPAAHIVSSGLPPSSESRETRWKAVVGLCESLRALQPLTVMETIEQLAANSDGPRLQRATTRVAAE